MILLDTCALLWLAHEKENLSPFLLNKLEELAIVYVSAISAFEIAIKYRSGKLTLPLPPGEWFHQALEHHNLAVIDLNPGICIKATELPPIHRDPCDRFIIATALLWHLPVVTSDRHFAPYGVEVLL